MVKSALLASASLLFVSHVLPVAQVHAADFYDGKTITIISGFSPGGGYDTYGRLVANHLGKHAPGTPSIIVRNMPGASSMKSVKYLYTTASQDGTTLTIFNPGLVEQSLTNPSVVDVDFTKLRFVGSVTSEVRVCYLTQARGIDSLDGFLKGGLFNFGATSTGATSYTGAALLKNLFGAQVKHVTGYPGSSEQRLALERGELDGMCGSWTSIPADWVRDKKVTPIVRFGRAEIDGWPKMPYIVDLAKTEEQRQILDLVLASSEFGRPFAMGPQVPETQLAIIRQAFDAMLKDSAFITEAEKRQLEIIAPMTGQEIESVIAKIYKTPPAVISKAAEALM
jgi:tripartite-type tricarboxylate transporter receptor subunit TctC